MHILGEEHFSDKGLSADVVNFKSLYLAVGHITYEDYDNVPKHRFDSDLKLNRDTARLPINSRLATEIKIPQIDYLNRFEMLLRDSWKDFNKEEIDSHPIGQVDSEDIVRNVICYRRLG